MGDADEIQRILSTKDLYNILGVARDADEDELRRKYKRLALICHPDKCSHPKAEEAFKAVGKAFSTLSDPQKRAQYDRYGEEGPPNGRTMHRQDMDPDDIYDIFAQMFGAELHQFQGRRYTYMRTRRGPAQAQAHQIHNAMQLFQILPIAIFLLVYMLFSIGGSTGSSPYSLHLDQDQGYSIKRKTKAHKIPYFVKSSFTSEYGRDATRLQHVEEHVFDSYKSYLNRRCRYEQREKTAMRQRASMFYSGRDQQVMMERADNMGTPACDELQNLISRFGY